MTLNCITHNRVFHLSYVSGLNIITTQYVNIFKTRHHKNHHFLRASFPLHQITSVNLYPVTSACESLISLGPYQTFPPLLYEVCI